MEFPFKILNERIQKLSFFLDAIWILYSNHNYSANIFLHVLFELFDELSKKYTSSLYYWRIREKIFLFGSLSDLRIFLYTERFFSVECEWIQTLFPKWVSLLNLPPEWLPNKFFNSFFNLLQRISPVSIREYSWIYPLDSSEFIVLP